MLLRYDRLTANDPDDADFLETGRSESANRFHNKFTNLSASYASSAVSTRNGAAYRPRLRSGFCKDFAYQPLLPFAHFFRERLKVEPTEIEDLAAPDGRLAH